MSTMRWIRETYGVPAKRGGRVLYDGRPGTILSVRGPHLVVRLDDNGPNSRAICHPTYRMNYVVEVTQ